MLQINKAETKSWYLTLSEKTTISNAVYLFNFNNRTTAESVNIILTDISSFKERYNKFTITEGSTLTLEVGEYQYNVYAQTSTSNIDINLTDELVESGILKVNPKTLVGNFYEPTLSSEQYYVPLDGIFDYKPLYYAYLKRVDISEGVECLEDKLYNLAKQI